MAPFRLLALLLVLPLSAVTAQQPTTPAPVNNTMNSVSRVTLSRILPGQAGAYARDIVDNLIPIYEAYKRAGLIVSYSFYSNATRENETDWDRGVTLTFANWAALDGLGEKTAPITLQHYGTAMRRAEANTARATLAAPVRLFLLTGQTYSR